MSVKGLSSYRLALGSALLPLGLGTVSFLLWIPGRWDFLITLWFVSFYAGLAAFFLGSILLVVTWLKWTKEARFTVGGRFVRVGGVWLLLLAGFPILPVAAVWVASTCPVQVRSPASLKEPVEIALVDYGDHSSLILPAPDGRFTEFAFGDWAYYAKNDQGIYSTLAALLWPTQGALGRRDLRTPVTGGALSRMIRCQAMHILKVERKRALALWKKLRDRHSRRRGQALENPTYGLKFVPDDDAYVCAYNCNDAVVRWLREAGCEVEGSAGISVFEVNGAADP